MLNQQEVASYVRENVNWNQFFTIIHHLNKEPGLNERMQRADKGGLLETSLDICSQSKLTRVNQKGVDHILVEHENLRMELKTAITTGIMYTKTGRVKAHETSDIALVNTMGEGTTNRKFPQTFDYLVVVDLFAVAVVAYDNLVQHVTTTNDQIKVRLPINSLSFVIQPGEYTITPVQQCVPYLTLKEQCQHEFLNQFVNVPNEKGLLVF
jgi:hypothetical protein